MVEPVTRIEVRPASDPPYTVQVGTGLLEELVEAYRLPEPIEQVGAWLFRVARNRLIDRFRKNKRRAPKDLHDAVDESDLENRLDLELPWLDQGPEALYARSTVLEALQGALDELPPDQCEVFVAHELEGRSFRQMAEESGISVNSLLTRKRSAILLKFTLISVRTARFLPRVSSPVLSNVRGS